MNAPPNIRDLLQGHVTLQLESLDRLYLNGYVAHLQHGAGLVRFLSQHRGNPIASPALLGQLTGQFVAKVRDFALNHQIPLFPFRHQESKDQRAHQLRRQRAVRDAVVFIGVAQEKAYAFSARRLPGKPVRFEFSRNKSVIPNYYYFYLDDSQWGESFLKVCSYAPWGLKLYLNGHEWLKRQLAQQGIGFEALDNGFLSCQDPKRLQELADSLGPAQLESFLTRILSEGVHPSLHVSYKHFDLKQYYKEGRGLRTEGTFHDPGDFGVNKGIENLPSLKELGHQINQRLLEVERVSQNCGLSAGGIQRVVLRATAHQASALEKCPNYNSSFPPVRIVQPTHGRDPRATCR